MAASEAALSKLIGARGVVGDQLQGKVLRDVPIYYLGGDVRTELSFTNNRFGEIYRLAILTLLLQSFSLAGFAVRRRNLVNYLQAQYWKFTEGI